MPKIVEDEHIFKAVLKVVSERGYSGAATKQMADAAGVSEVTLFRKYGNKSQLVKQAISYIVKQTNFTASTKYTGDIRVDLLRVVQGYQDTAVKHGDFLFSLFADLTRHPELIESIEEPFNLFKSIGELISRYQQEGVLRTEHPLHAVASLLGPLMYISIIQRENLDNKVPSIDFSEHITKFLEGRFI